MTKTLEAHDKLIREIFEGNYRFEIPEYQRPYAWTTEQTEELFDDLLGAMHESDSSKNKMQYFLGSIVLIKNEEDVKSMVVDGQQRLTTLTILFAALRNLMPEAADDITDFLYKRGKASLGEQNEYRLIARKEDSEFFRKNIQEPVGFKELMLNTQLLEDSELNFRENAKLLNAKASKLTADEMSKFWKFIAYECSLVLITTSDFDAAYKIFSVLNNRGLDLAPIDIIKADILGKIRSKYGPEESKEYADEWSVVEGTLGREAFGELFSHIRSIYVKKKQQKTLVNEFTESVISNFDSKYIVDEIIQPYSEVWNYLRNSSFSSEVNAEQINDLLSWLNRVTFKDWVPPTLVFFERFRQRPDILLEFAKKLERLTYYLLVTRAGINERIETFGTLTDQISAEAFSGDVNLLTTLQLSASQKIEFKAALDGDIYRKLPRARMPLLLRLESLMTDGTKSLDFRDVSLEHVLPQNPRSDSEWLSWFPVLEERESWTHRVANLVPLHFAKNPSASNFAFNEKKDVYFIGGKRRNATKDTTSSPFVLVNELRDIERWNPEILKVRQERLLERFINHWELN